MFQIKGGVLKPFNERNSMNLHFVAVGAILLWSILNGGSGFSQTNWPQFRGQGGRGIGNENAAVPSKLKKKNLIWTRTIGNGHSSPCIWGDHIFLTSHESTMLKTTCIHRKTGEVIWAKSVSAQKVEKTHRVNGQATPSPTADGERVYVYFGSYGIICYDFAGKEVWKKPLPIPGNHFGSAASPIIAKDKLVFCCDMKSGSYLEAINRKTGATLWKQHRPSAKAGWSSPMLWSNDGVDEIVVYGVWWLKAYDLASGAERWSTPGLTDEPCITPVHGQGLVFVTSYNMKTNPEVIGIPDFPTMLKEYDKNQDKQLSLEEVKSNKSVLSRNDADGEGDHPVRGFFRYLDVDKNGELTAEEWKKMLAFLDRYQHENAVIAIRPGSTNRAAEIVWKQQKGVPECPSPLYYQENVYVIKNGGILSCLDAKTGKLKYRARLGSGGPYYASLVAAGGKIYAASARGVVTIFEAGDALKILSRNQLNERIMATPAIVDGQVFVRTEKALHAFE